jgi:hypothetical protein
MDILGFAIVAQNSASHTVQALIVSAHDDFEHRCLTRQHTGHNFRIMG